MNVTLGGRYGFNVAIKQVGERWVWTLKRYGKDVASGVELTMEAAQNGALAAYAGKAWDNGLRSKERAAARSKLRYWAQTRPHLMCHLLRSLSYPGMDQARFMKEAAEGERWVWEEDRSPNKPPLPTHALAKPAMAIAEEVWGLLRKTGMVKDLDSGWVFTKAKRWGISMFGSHAMQAETTEERAAREDMERKLQAMEAKRGKTSKKESKRR